MRAPLDGRLVARSQEHLQDQLLHPRLHQTRQLREDVAHLVRLAALPIRPRPDPPDGLLQPRVAVEDHHQRIAQSTGRHVLQERQPRVEGLPGSKVQVQQHGGAVFQQRIGRQDSFLLLGSLPQSVVLPVEEQVHDLHLAEVALLPPVEVPSQPARDAADRGLAQPGLTERLGVEIPNVLGGQPADVHPAHQRLQVGTSTPDPTQQRRPERFRGSAHLRDLEVPSPSGSPWVRSRCAIPSGASRLGGSAPGPGTPWLRPRCGPARCSGRSDGGTLASGPRPLPPAMPLPSAAAPRLPSSSRSVVLSSWRRPGSLELVGKLPEEAQPRDGANTVLHAGSHDDQLLLG